MEYMRICLNTSKEARKKTRHRDNWKDIEIVVKVEFESGIKETRHFNFNIYH